MLVVGHTAIGTAAVGGGAAWMILMSEVRLSPLIDTLKSSTGSGRPGPTARHSQRRRASIRPCIF